MPCYVCCVLHKIEKFYDFRSFDMIYHEQSAPKKWKKNANKYPLNDMFRSFDASLRRVHLPVSVILLERVEVVWFRKSVYGRTVRVLWGKRREDRNPS